MWMRLVNGFKTTQDDPCVSNNWICLTGETNAGKVEIITLNSFFGLRDIYDATN